jgi:uracil-DNA glycosylase family 4
MRESQQTESERTVAQAARRVLQQRLENLSRAGVTHLGRVPEFTAPLPVTPSNHQIVEPAMESRTRMPTRDTVPAKPESVAPPPLTKVPAASVTFKSDPAPSLFTTSSEDATLTQETIVPPKKRPAALEVIRLEVASCMRCEQLCTTRTNTVFGVGNPQARLAFLGEAPGADEDAQGEPFVGRAGQLLTKIIEACQLKREDLYILNVLKCRPPNNRPPLPDEVANCRGYLDRQLAILRPEYLCCLGTTAAQTLLETDEPIGRMRGKFQMYRGIPVMCTYHPSYLLRNPAAKKIVWEDMKLLMKRLGIEL